MIETKAIRARRGSLMRKYNLTLEEWQDMFLAQNECCAICHRPGEHFKNGLHVDHDHSTRAVRGLLCFPCNRLIPNRVGMTELMQKVINYLNNPPATLVLGETRYANAGKRGKRKVKRQNKAKSHRVEYGLKPKDERAAKQSAKLLSLVIADEVTGNRPFKYTDKQPKVD